MPNHSLYHHFLTMPHHHLSMPITCTPITFPLPLRHIPTAHVYTIPCTVTSPCPVTYVCPSLIPPSLPSYTHPYHISHSSFLSLAKTYIHCPFLDHFPYPLLLTSPHYYICPSPIPPITYPFLPSLPIPRDIPTAHSYTITSPAPPIPPITFPPSSPSSPVPAS